METPDDQLLRSITIFDMECLRTIHSRLYTVTELLKLNDYGRFNDYIAVYFGDENSHPLNHFVK